MTQFLVRVGLEATLPGVSGVALLLKSGTVQARPESPSGIIPGLLHRGFTRNTGMAWSLPGNRTQPGAAPAEWVHPPGLDQGEP
ncbi:hypothetical protein [Deinococcus humi]|uniref:Uncharacterized protein n=1 Tax=Deinococcus humi TaxID=662880 RepID=A0A7W8NG58_9DEIO|nr:hypothetical protein [Deinococcus humi]MBB5364470.1 hypothetical protein [Deinococcus humi]